MTADDMKALRAELAAWKAAQTRFERPPFIGSPDRIARLLDALEAAQADAASWAQQASDRAADAVQFAAERDAAQNRLAVALGEVQHTYQGDCPDELDRNRRDPECPACRILGDA